MLDSLQDLVPLGQLTGIGVTSVIAWMVITRKLVWHKDLETEKTDAQAVLGKCEKERDEWKHIALSLLGVTEKLTVQAEVTNEVISRLPGPRPTES